MDQASTPRVVQLVKLDEHRDGAYRAIGRYFVQFSSLVALMRQMIEEQIATDDPPKKLLGLAFGSLTAQPISDAFFAMCRALGELDKPERKIEKCLRGQVDQEIRRRNIIAHGDWFVAKWAEPSEDPPRDIPTTLVRVKASSTKEPFQYEDLPVSTIDAHGEEVEALEQVVCEFGCVCTRQGPYDPALGRPVVRVRDALQIVEKHVVFRSLPKTA